MTQMFIWVLTLFFLAYRQETREVSFLSTLFSVQTLIDPVEIFLSFFGGSPFSEFLKDESEKGNEEKGVKPALTTTRADHKTCI